MKFSAFLKHTLQYLFMEQELLDLEEDIVTYVQEYEKYIKFQWILSLL